jgi:hypothetical protein
MVSSEMAKVEYADAIKTVSGALTKINKKSPHAVDQKMVLATHRNAPTTQVGKCNRMYLRGLNSVTRSTPVSADEVEHRTKFSAVSAAVSARMKDPTKQAADLAAFNAQKNTAGGKTTMRSYIWSLESAAYDQNNG